MIHLITGTAGTGKTLKMFKAMMLDARLRGKQSLIFTEDRIANREDLMSLMNQQCVPNTMVCEMSIDDFLWNMNKNINPVIPTSKTTRVGIDYSVLSPRIVEACHKLSEMGYEVWVTCQVMRPSAPAETDFEKLFK